MKKEWFVSLALWLVTVNTYSASQHIIWGSPDQTLPPLKSPLPLSRQGLSTQLQAVKTSDYQLVPLTPATASKKHVRYQLMYKGIPVWGHQLVFHARKASEPQVTGMSLSGIENDISTVRAKLSASEVERDILGRLKHKVKFKSIKTVIYIDQHEKAHLAYHLACYLSDKKTLLKAPNYLIDANNGRLLKQWDEVHHLKVGQGLGGNAFDLPYRSGKFQYGKALPGLPSLGKFDVQIEHGLCRVENDNVRVINLANEVFGYEGFPISIFDETENQLNAFAYPCDLKSRYVNYTDGMTGPVNYAFSPVNDAMYFAQETLDMYQRIYGVLEPLGDDLPLRAYTHLGAMDNAFAIPTIRVDGQILAHQQIVIGNGDLFLTAPAQTVVAHELSHIFTERHSALIYEGQSGAINEAFSDMASIALQDYLRQRYPWYWDGRDWGLGREAVIGGEPLRYMDDPARDGSSIAHADDYMDDLNVHHSSGVFNKAFYLLANKPGWTIQKAFQVMVDANQYYWSPIAYYDFAACGVIAAAIDRDFDKTSVIEAFAEVGVMCPVQPL